MFSISSRVDKNNSTFERFSLEQFYWILYYIFCGGKIMKIAISCETTVDVTKDLISKYNLHIVPFTIVLGNEQKLDGDITPEEIFSFVKETGKLPKTSAVNQFQYEEHFENILKEYDAIIHLTLSSLMSSAYQNAVEASKKYQNVKVIDSKTLSTGIALLALYAKELVDANHTLDEIVKKVQNRIPSNQASFILENVDFLYKGGRCSVLSYIGANLLSLKPQIIVKNGKMVAGKKFRGKFSKCVKQYVEHTLEQFNNPDKTRVFLTYTTADQETLGYITKRLYEVGFKEVLLTTAGGTISSHCGPHCLGILYFNDGGVNK